MARLTITILLAAALGCSDSTSEPESPTSFHLDTIASGFTLPAAVQRDSQGLLLALQTGLVVRLNGSIVHDFRTQVPADLNLVGGLLNFLVVGARHFVFLTTGDNDHTLVAEILGTRLDTLMLTTDLKVEHHGGGLAWYKGKLIAAIGEGDSGTGRGPGVAGKILSIDPSTRRIDILASGLRNPWRIALAGDSLWITDAGDRMSEEVNVLDLRTPGADFGWGISEGTSCTAASCAGVRWPVFSYPTGLGCSTVVGAAWYGARLWFADYCQRWVSTLDRAGIETRVFTLMDDIISISPSDDGGPFILTADGDVLRIVAEFE